jgi:hypothetical protein
MRELELHPPAEDWNRRMLAGGPGSAFLESEYEEAENLDPSPIELWPRKRRRVEHDAAFGLRTAVGLGSFTTLLGSRRDVITSQWKAPSHGVWHKVCPIASTCRFASEITYWILQIFRACFRASPDRSYLANQNVKSLFTVFHSIVVKLVVDYLGVIECSVCAVGARHQH